MPFLLTVFAGSHERRGAQRQLRPDNIVRKHRLTRERMAVSAARNRGEQWSTKQNMFSIDPNY